MIIENSIYVYDTIVSSQADADAYGGVAADWFADALRQLNHHRQVDVYINSAGGSVYGGIAMYESIMRARKQGQIVNTIIDGAALSIASVVALAGATITMSSAGAMMIHTPHTPHAAGDSRDLQKMIDALEVATGQIIAVYKTRMKQQSKAEIRKLMDAETWYSATEAKAAGLIDQITTAPSRMAAQCNVGEYNVPPRIMAEIRAPIDRQIREVVKECAAVRVARSYDDALAAKIRAAEVAERLTYTPGATSTDFAIVAWAMDRADVYHNELEW